jgi:hypothetical protein
LNKIVLLSVLMPALALIGCNDDSSPGTNEAGNETETGDGDGDPETGDGDPETGDGDPETGDGDPETGDGDPETGDGDPDPADPFIFANSDPGDYTRVDRVGMPGVSMMLITDKDAYNAANPSDDANASFVGEITTNIQALHTALDGALIDNGLMPCVAATCLLQAQPLIIPDTLKLNLTEEPGFPNGRTLTDQVMDMMLALILLNLGAADQDITTLIGQTNPLANDVDFLDEFPFLAEPH